MRTKMKLVLTKQWAAFPHDVSVHDMEQHIPRCDLGTLFYEAYLGTIDYEGETLAQAVQEITDTINGKYGPLIRCASFVAEMFGEPVSLGMVTLWHDRPSLAYAATHPNHINRGLSTNLIKCTVNALMVTGYEDLYLVVTNGNAPAVHIYQKLGFVPIIE